ncbi:zinc finger protein 724-like [Culicoides brevitarsis]|uniref:zinc finger protein 724-like n=1 Tax=Culicoides brevitarsis TaxID=469753 RepID=UPI00307B6B39
MEQFMSSCRVCLCFIDKETKLEQDCNDNNNGLVKFYFEKSTNYKILSDEPQNCCSFCYAELLQSVRFIEKCERTQKILDGLRTGIETKSETVSVKDYSHILDVELKEEVEENVKVDRKTPKRTKKLEIKVICPYCATLVKSSYLENHIKSVHSEPRNAFMCDICSTHLSSKKSVIRHMNHVHLKMQKYKCKICGIEFPNESLRKAHLLQIHKVVPPKACPYCDYRAFTKAHITRHTMRHRGDRRFKCPTCNFAFVTLLQLQTHQAVHSDERNFECSECLKRFKTKKNLSAHKKCHLAYEYECAVCGKAFLTNQMMRNHVTKMHPEYELPPAGTVMNKEAVKRMKNIEKEVLNYHSTKTEATNALK